MDCPDCGAPIIARLKTYKDNQYPAYVQWQNEKETTSHKTKEGDCKDTNTSGSANVPDPNSSTVIQKSTLETNTANNIQTDYLTDATKKSIKDTAETLWYIRIQVEQTIKDLEVNPHGGMIWEMSKIIYQELYGDKKQ